MSTSAIGISDRAQLIRLNDGQLLERFVDGGEQASFAALLQRHGPMVLGVCRRILRHDQDTEDAVQATFVVLARKARSISKHDSVASWMYKVAYRIAIRLRADTIRRREREQLASTPQEADDGLDKVIHRELRQVLDEEVRRLPEKYRAPILLCYLQGQTNEEAAALLRCPTGTIKIRLLRGRELIRKRLVKRGVALTVMGLLGEALEGMARAAVPQTLLDSAARAAAGTASSTIATLADSALKGMCLAKLKVAAVVLLTLSLLSLADGLLACVAAAPVLQKEKSLTHPESAPTALHTTLVASREP